MSATDKDVYGLYMTDWVTHAEVTQLAASTLRQVVESERRSGTRSERQTALRKTVHFEHNAPVKVKRMELLQLLKNNQVLHESVEASLNTGFRIEVVSRTELAHLNNNQFRSSGTMTQRSAALQDAFYDGASMYLSAHERRILADDLARFLNG